MFLTGFAHDFHARAHPYQRSAVVGVVALSVGVASVAGVGVGSTTLVATSAGLASAAGASAAVVSGVGNDNPIPESGMGTVVGVGQAISSAVFGSAGTGAGVGVQWIYTPGRSWTRSQGGRAWAAARHPTDRTWRPFVPTRAWTSRAPADRQWAPPVRSRLWSDI